MKKILLPVLALFALIACEKAPQDSIKLSQPDVTVGFEGTTEPVSIDVKSNIDWTVTAEEADWFTIEPLEGSGDGTITVTVEPLTEIAARAAIILVGNGTTTVSFQIVQGLPETADVSEGGFVIEEVFFAGFLPEGGTSSDASDGDQYIKITNNSENLLYADGLLVCLSSYNSQVSAAGAYWEPTVTLADSIGVNALYRIPGAGSDVPVLPGKSLVIALAAQDFSAENGAGLDLSKADFEIFDGEDYDTDNPDVPNIENWVVESETFSMLHNRGFFSLALAKVPYETAAAYMEACPWTGTETFWFNGAAFTTRDIAAGNYILKNEWVVDAVNLGIEEDLGRLAFNASVDAGYTGCGKVDRDPDRYGKSALRKSEDGKLADTNNSTNDFTRDSVPSLK